MRFLRSAQGLVGLKGEVDVLLADDRRLRQLNREFRGKDRATDVLSFPAAAAFAGQHAGDLAGGCAGDMAVSLETAARQAAEQGHSLRDEVRVLLLHGLLHLYGMDHETDAGEMERREAELRMRLRLPRGLIARAQATADAKRRFPLGMTERKARAETTATAKVTATPKAKAKEKAKACTLSVSSFELRVASEDGTAIAKKRVRR